MDCKNRTQQEQSSTHHCIVNLGLFRTGTTTLARAAEELGLTVFRAFPHINDELHREFILNPEKRIRKWWQEENGSNSFLETIAQYNMVCDGWAGLLILLPREELINVYFEALSRNIKLCFVATTRPTDSMIASELHHWVRNNLAEKASLTYQENCDLEFMLYSRANAHDQALRAFSKCIPDIQLLPKDVLLLLPLKEIETSWPCTLARWGFSETSWSAALQSTGIQNFSPPLPIEGVLLTFRIGDFQSLMKNISRLIRNIEEDSICQYLIVIALDHDEADSLNADDLIKYIKNNSRAKDVILLVNPTQNQMVFPICQVWHRMAEAAWSRGASWVMLLGDDVVIHCPFHYRAIYRAFLQLSEDLSCPFGFGCPWFNDITFPGFPTFPIVGRAHLNIFGGLIPKHRSEGFCNQDLDPYLQRLYLKFGASPLLKDVKLSNTRGGSNGDVRYEQIYAVGWRDWVLDDVDAIETYIQHRSLKAVEPRTLVDVIVPSYRLNLGVLEKICTLRVPQCWRTQFIIIVDNPDLLIQKVTEISAVPSSTDISQSLVLASSQLEKYLSAKSVTSTYDGNNVRVRTNAINSGASASRNRGLDESAAEYVLFLDDDVVPEANLLEAYEKYLSFYKTPEDKKFLLGLVGLVKFPRSPKLPLKHASVLMSYLTFMFEIASNPIYKQPAWGVTANLLVKRVPGMRFDTAYAKTGGGEDVDFCLRMEGGHLKAAPSAVVYHPFWDGSILHLFSHFYQWAVGDSALFSRFPTLVYHSYPNAAEILLLMILPMALLFSWSAKLFVLIAILVIACDVAVDLTNLQEFHHRCELLEYPFPLWYCVSAHILANLYVIVLEIGRLWGHCHRGQLGHITKRFDWHCGQLPASPEKFRQKEFWKFTAFVVTIAGTIWICGA